MLTHTHTLDNFEGTRLFRMSFLTYINELPFTPLFFQHIADKDFHLQNDSYTFDEE